ncbi:MAG: folate family ECF transporter S component [Oscillospiraceae bacterium]|jgi:ECF transporter S component (folate family)|nr:folate family ECF transporter S component [Oscillospiraceae bacterium]
MSKTTSPAKSKTPDAPVLDTKPSGAFSAAHFGVLLIIAGTAIAGLAVNLVQKLDTWLSTGLSAWISDMLLSGELPIAAPAEGEAAAKLASSVPVPLARILLLALLGVILIAFGIAVLAASVRKSSVFKIKFSLRLLTHLAMLAALEIVLNRFLSINTTALKIGFAFVAIVVASAAYGPIWGAVTYAVADVVGALLFPTGPIMFGITADCAAMGFMFGMFLYGIPAVRLKSAATWARVVTPVLINSLLFGLVLNSYWLSLIYSARSFGYFFTMRLTEYAVLIPIEIALIPALLAFVARLRKSRLLAQ